MSCRRLVRTLFRFKPQNSKRIYVTESKGFLIFLIRNEDLKVICQEYCESDSSECFQSCLHRSAGTNCFVECGKKLSECSNGMLSRINLKITVGFILSQIVSALTHLELFI